MVTIEYVGKRVIYTHYPEDQNLWKDGPGTLSKDSVNIEIGKSYILDRYISYSLNHFIILREEGHNESYWKYPVQAFEPEESYQIY